ncbi:MAG: 50S ribosomal protein L3 [Spirochaetales bacterium]|nr:50S ribosomal protein L3 [Spirochaetales bacterium]
MIGLMGKKIGMTQIFDETKGILIPVTVINIDDNVVIGHKTEEKNGYTAVVLGAFDQKKSRVSKPALGQYAENVSPKKSIMEFRDFEKEVAVGDSLGVDVFEGHRYVDVIGMSKGKGYQGVMKRHGFGGGRKTHGSKFHRENGSTGNAATPSKVQKGRKMAGRMGFDKTTVQNLRLVKIDAEKKVVLVKGAVPGPKGSLVIVRDAKKK